MRGMPTLTPGVGFAGSRPQTKQQNRGSSHVSPSTLPGSCRPPLLALLCNCHGRPAAQQREAFMLGHKAHQIQLFWKGWAVFPPLKGYSHALSPAVIFLPQCFHYYGFFLFVFSCGGCCRTSAASCVSTVPFLWADDVNRLFVLKVQTSFLQLILSQCLGFTLPVRFYYNKIFPLPA